MKQRSYLLRGLVKLSRCFHFRYAVQQGKYVALICTDYLAIARAKLFAYRSYLQVLRFADLCKKRHRLFSNLLKICYSL